MKQCLLDTITYVKVSGGHFELEDTIKCYIYTPIRSLSVSMSETGTYIESHIRHCQNLLIYIWLQRGFKQYQQNFTIQILGYSKPNNPVVILRSRWSLHQRQCRQRAQYYSSYGYSSFSSSWYLKRDYLAKMELNILSRNSDLLNLKIDNFTTLSSK